MQQRSQRKCQRVGRLGGLQGDRIPRSHEDELTGGCFHVGLGVCHGDWKAGDPTKSRRDEGRKKRRKVGKSTLDRDHEDLCACASTFCKERNFNRVKLIDG